ncbi:antitoxin VbhA family protein [Ochrobactrum sp. 3-3]|uniref:antitoxin VbhA family protein n=1 Tax=Ochrobactrum sp. 3-3 TaxID=1830124 RepID=UPI000DEFCA0F|nr:antitoxin VbhA family protein [Ochrobactrum sp. 3-3]
MNIQTRRPDRSPEAVARRKKATDQARAANIRQGYTYDPLLEEATAAFVAGDITMEEYQARVVRPTQRS